MIVAFPRSRGFQRSVRRAARPDEDVVVGLDAWDALRRGYPRAVLVEAPDGRRVPAGLESARCAVLVVDPPVRTRWEVERRRGGPGAPPSWTGYAASRILRWLETTAARPTPVDRDLRDLGRVAGRAMPAALRGMARRVLEYPCQYPDLAAVGRIGRLSAGALKARFRRRGVPSPHVYLRWLRCLAVAHVLSDRSVTTGDAARRVGMSSGGNLCRAVQSTCGFTPTRLRSEGGRHQLMVDMARELLGADALARWEGLDDVFIEAA